MIMKKQYLEPSISLMMVECLPMMAASDPENYDPNASTTPVKGSDATSNRFNFELDEDAEW